MNAQNFRAGCVSVEVRNENQYRLDRCAGQKLLLVVGLACLVACEPTPSEQADAQPQSKAAASIPPAPRSWDCYTRQDTKDGHVHCIVARGSFSPGSPISLIVAKRKKRNEEDVAYDNCMQAVWGNQAGFEEHLKEPNIPYAGIWDNNEVARDDVSRRSHRWSLYRVACGNGDSCISTTGGMGDFRAEILLLRRSLQNPQTDEEVAELDEMRTIAASYAGGRTTGNLLTWRRRPSIENNGFCIPTPSDEDYVPQWEVPNE